MGTTPAVLNILDDVEARMGIMTIARGYWYDVQKVERARTSLWEGYDLPALTFYHTQVINDRDAYTGDERELRLFIEYHSQTRDEPFTDVAEKLATDVLVALNRLPANTAGSSIGVDASSIDMSAVANTKFKISADGDAAEEVICVWTGKTTGALVAAEMQSKIQALGVNKANVTVLFSEVSIRYIITSGTTGASSAVVITAGDTLDCTGELRIGVDNNGQEFVGQVAAPAVADEPNYDLNGTVKDIVFDGYDLQTGTGQEPWCGVLLKFGVKYLTDPFDPFNYRRE